MDVSLIHSNAWNFTTFSLCMSLHRLRKFGLKVGSSNFIFAVSQTIKIYL